MIAAKNLVKRFDKTAALDGLTTEIERGHIYGLVGPNGAGKSTLLRLISGIYMPDGGEITIDGQNLYENVALKDRVFYLSDDIFLLPRATTDSMAKFYAGLYSGFSWERYHALQKQFPIDTTKRLSTMSKGQRRQGALMVALSAGTDYVLLDEAFDGLDPVIRLLTKKLLADEIATRDLTVLITSHSLRELEELCDQIGLIHNGRLMFQRELDELKFGCCKVQAVFRTVPDWQGFGFDILQNQQKGSVINLLVRGSAEEVLPAIEQLEPVFSEVVPLTLEEVFIAEMEAVGYDYNNLVL